jgi:hypothetical protein
LHINWEDEWKQVLFTNECSIEYSKVYEKYCWRKPGEGLKVGCYKGVPRQYIKKYIKVWGAI